MNAPELGAAEPQLYLRPRLRLGRNAPRLGRHRLARQSLKSCVARRSLATRRELRAAQVISNVISTDNITHHCAKPFTL
jgi:hypothetical protein